MEKKGKDLICISVNKRTNVSCPEMWKKINTEVPMDKEVFTNKITNTNSTKTMESKFRLLY